MVKSHTLRPAMSFYCSFFKKTNSCYCNLRLSSNAHASRAICLCCELGVLGQSESCGPQQQKLRHGRTNSAGPHITSRPTKHTGEALRQPAHKGRASFFDRKGVRQRNSHGPQQSRLGFVGTKMSHATRQAAAVQSRGLAGVAWALLPPFATSALQKISNL